MEARVSACQGREDFRERRMPRLDDRHTASQRFQDVQSERFAVGRRHGKHRQPAEELRFRCAIEIGMELDHVQTPGLPQLLAQGTRTLIYYGHFQSLRPYPQHLVPQGKLSFSEQLVVSFANH